MNHWREGYRKLEREMRLLTVTLEQEMADLRAEMEEHKRITEPSILQKVSELIKVRDDSKQDVAGGTGVVQHPWG